MQAPADPPHVLANLSGNGIGNSTPFQIDGNHVTVDYSYDCSNFGDSGNFIGDLESSADDQSFANEIGPSGSTETTAYPTDQGGIYHVSVDSECAWNVTVTGS